MLFVVRLCSKLEWSGKFNISGDFAGQATFLTFANLLNQGFGDWISK